MFIISNIISIIPRHIQSIHARPLVNGPFYTTVRRQWKVNPSKLDTQWNDYFRALEATTETAGDN